MPNYTVLHKRGTSSQWLSATSALAQSQLGFETDTRRMRIGDGTTAFSSLPFIVTSADPKFSQPISATPSTSLPMNVYQETGETTRSTKLLVRESDPGLHSGFEKYAFGVEHRAVGSGTNGPQHADTAAMFSIAKKDFDTTSVTGEIEAAQFIVRQGGQSSDCSGWLANVVHYGTGYACIYEAICGHFSSQSSTMDKYVRTQCGVIDTVNEIYFGHHLRAEIGTFDYGLLIACDAGAEFTYPIQYLDGTGASKFHIANDGSIHGAATVNAGTLYRVNGTQVISARQTAWAAMTGSADKSTTYDVGSVTLAQLAGRVKAIQDALTTHGLIGA